MKFPNVKSKVFLAPMAGVNCASFRLLCKDFGAGMVYSPMIHINRLLNSDESLLEILAFSKKEKPLAVQIVGHDKSLLKDAIGIIEPIADIIDINFGCPDLNIIKSNSGSYFLKHPDEMEKFAQAVVGSTNKPVTAKIRTGWDRHKTKKYITLLQNAGVQAIAIHPRTVKQGYSGKADWSEIKKAKEYADIPIIGNGDIFKPGTAKAMFDSTKCDFVMVGRGAIGNPFIFQRINHLLETGKNSPEPSRKDRVDAFKKMLVYYKKYDDLRSINELKQHSAWFLKGLDNCKKYKVKLLKADNIDQILEIYNSISKDL